MEEKKLTEGQYLLNSSTTITDVEKMRIEELKAKTAYIIDRLLEFSEKNWDEIGPINLEKHELYNMAIRHYEMASMLATKAISKPNRD